MAQIGKSIKYRYGGQVYTIPLFNAIADTSGSVLPVRTDGNIAYAQALPASGGYNPSKVHFRRSGTEYVLGFTACPTTQKNEGNPGFSRTVNSGEGNYTIQSLTFAVPHFTNVRLTATITWSASHSGYYGGAPWVLLDGGTIYAAPMPSGWSGSGTNTLYDGNVSLSAGQHTLAIGVLIWGSGGDSSTFSCSYALNRAILSEV